VPTVAGKTSVEAEELLRSSDLNPTIKKQLDNKVPAGTVIGTDPTEGAKILRGDPVTLIVSVGKPTVPNVQAGLDEAEARRLIADQQLIADVDDGQNRFDDDVEKGKVITTNPQPGTKLDIGSRVVIVISKGREPKPVPDLRNKTRDEAFEQLQELGFEPQEGTAEFDADVEGGRVIRTDPKAGTKPAGDDRKVVVILSSAVTVPDLTGKSVDEAEDQLKALGLKIDVQSVVGGREGRVFNQSPGPNSRIEPGGRVTVAVFPF
jgi:serine/threonine-protein kinase